MLYIGTLTTPPLLLPSGESITVCSDFKYFGAHVLNPDKQFAERRKLAWVAARSLRQIFNSPASDCTKTRLFQSVVESVLLYGLEAIPITVTREAAMDRSHRCLLRYALGIHYPVLIGNDELYARSRVPPLSTTLRQRRLLLLGHILREDARRVAEKEERTPAALVLEHVPTETFRRGMSQLVTLRDTFVNDLQLLGLRSNTVHNVHKHTYRRDVLSL